jgi:hypothetical protein
MVKEAAPVPCFAVVDKEGLVCEMYTVEPSVGYMSRATKHFPDLAPFAIQSGFFITAETVEQVRRALIPVAEALRKLQHGDVYDPGWNTCPDCQRLDVLEKALSLLPRVETQNK